MDTRSYMRVRNFSSIAGSDGHGLRPDPVAGQQQYEAVATRARVRFLRIGDVAAETATWIIKAVIASGDISSTRITFTGGSAARNSEGFGGN